MDELIQKFYQLEEQLVNLSDDCKDCKESKESKESKVCNHSAKVKIIRKLLFAVVQEITCDYEKLTSKAAEQTKSAEQTKAAEQTKFAEQTRLVLPESFCRECMASKFKIQCPKHRTITLSEIREQLLAIRATNMRIKESLPESITQDLYDKILAEHEKSQDRAMLLISVLMNNFSFMNDPVVLEKMVNEKLLCPQCIKNRFIGMCTC